MKKYIRTSITLSKTVNSRRRNKFHSTHTGLFFFALFLASQATWAVSYSVATFLGLGDLPGGGVESYAYGVSADGSVVVGYSNSTSGPEAFHWNLAGGMLGLGDLPGGNFFSRALSVSGNGSVVVGWSESDDISTAKAFRWTSDAGMTELGNGWGFDISADGSVVVGGIYNANTNTMEPFRWTSGSGVVGLGTLPGDSFGYAHTVSADGSVVVGSSGNNAFRWTSGTGMVGLDNQLGGGTNPLQVARGISADGSVIVGAHPFNGVPLPYRWTLSGGTEQLDLLKNGGWSGIANAASADGSIIVGNNSIGPGIRAFVWDEIYGTQDLEDILTAEGVDITGWQLGNATDISDNGRVIVGSGFHNGNTEAWMITLQPIPIPAALPLFATVLSALGIMGFKRKKIT